MSLQSYFYSDFETCPKCAGILEYDTGNLERSGKVATMKAVCPDCGAKVETKFTFSHVDVDGRVSRWKK